MTDARTPEVVVNHDEAWSLAHLKREESNLARCYIDLRQRMVRINAINDNPARYDDELDKLSKLEFGPRE